MLVHQLRRRLHRHLVCTLLTVVSSVLLLSGSQPSAAQPVAFSPKYEVRAVWLTTLSGLDWPRTQGEAAQRRELCTILDQLHEAGINTVLFQTRIRGTVVYDGSSEPWDAAISGTAGQRPTYDPLRVAVEECHRRGMQLHAWVVTLPLGKWTSAGCRDMRRRQPSLVRRAADNAFMDPTKAATADYLGRLCADITRRYDIDGIHLDYIRYPDGWPRDATPAATKRANITRIARSIYEAVKREKPWVIVSCSPVGKSDNLTRYSSRGWNARSAVYQDAQNWLAEGVMDALFPMMYFRDDHFFPFAIDWQEQSAGRLVVPGLGIYFLDPREGKWQLSDVQRQLSASRDIGMGHCYFRSRFLLDDVKGILQFSSHFDATPALLPPMPWLSDRRPAAPSQLRFMAGSLTWQLGADSIREGGVVCNVYASREWPVDISDPRHLIATRLCGSRISLPASALDMNFAVTCQNRYGLESQPAMLRLTSDDRTVRKARFNPSPLNTAWRPQAPGKAKKDGKKSRKEKKKKRK